LSIVRIFTNRKHNVSETGPVSVFRQGGGGAPTLQKNQKLAFPQAMPEQKKIRTMDKVQKLNSNECYTPSSEPFRMYIRTSMLWGNNSANFPLMYGWNTMLKSLCIQSVISVRWINPRKWRYTVRCRWYQHFRGRLYLEVPLKSDTNFPQVSVAYERSIYGPDCEPFFHEDWNLVFVTALSIKTFPFF
jgi:hypothetical protein